jgi:hypothetical protein
MDVVGPLMAMMPDRPLRVRGVLAERAQLPFQIRDGLFETSARVASFNSAIPTAINLPMIAPISTTQRAVKRSGAPSPAPSRGGHASVAALPAAPPTLALATPSLADGQGAEPPFFNRF